jgi:O-antigen ligase
MINQTLKDLGFSGNQFYFFSITHQSIYSTALKMFLDKPLFGHGTKMFRVVCNEEKYQTTNLENSKFSCSSHPHNYYIQFLAETGIIGFLFLFSFYLFIFFKLIQAYFSKKHDNDFQIHIYLVILIVLFPIIPTGNFFNNWIAIQYILPIAFLLKFKNRKIII